MRVFSARCATGDSSARVSADSRNSTGTTLFHGNGGDERPGIISNCCVAPATGRNRGVMLEAGSHDPAKGRGTRGRNENGTSGRVDLGGCPPRSPTDPGLHMTRTRFLIS